MKYKVTFELYMIADDADEAVQEAITEINTANDEGQLDDIIINVEEV